MSGIEIFFRKGIFVRQARKSLIKQNATDEKKPAN
jgi:hypothetical protein